MVVVLSQALKESQWTVLVNYLITCKNISYFQKRCGLKLYLPATPIWRMVNATQFNCCSTELIIFLFPELWPQQPRAVSH